MARTGQPAVSAGDEAQIRSIFRQLDENGDDVISFDEFRRGMLLSGCAEHNIPQLCSRMGLNEGSVLDYDTFAQGFQQLPAVLNKAQAAQLWTYIAEEATCSLYHHPSGAVVELSKVRGAFFHFRANTKGKGCLCEESAAVRQHRTLKSDSAITKLEKGKGKELDARWEWEGWHALICPPQVRLVPGWCAKLPCGRSRSEAATEANPVHHVTQIGIYRSQNVGEVRLVDVVQYVDTNVDIRKMHDVRVSPLLVLDAEGFSLIGVKGHCISCRNDRLHRYGLQAQVNVPSQCEIARNDR